MLLLFNWLLPDERGLAGSPHSLANRTERLKIFQKCPKGTGHFKNLSAKCPFCQPQAAWVPNLT